MFEPVLTRFIIIFLLFIFCFFSVGYSQDNYIVKNVKFSGNESLSAGELKQLISLRPRGWFNRLLGQGTKVRYSRELLNSDLTIIKDYYQRRGFLNAEAKLGQLKTNDEKETVKINININEGEPIIVSEISFQFVDDTLRTRVEQLMSEYKSELNTKEGQRFRDAVLKEDINQLQTRLINNGYPYEEINYQLQVKQSENTVHIKLKVNAGPLCEFGAVSVSGNSHVSDRLIRKQVAFDRGETFRKRLVDKSQEQVYELGVFQIVTVRAQIPKKEQTTSIPVQVNVREASQYTTKFGVGWGTEDKFRTFIDFRWLHFLGGARRLNIDVKHSALEPYNVNIRATQPAFLNPNTSLGINPYIRKQDEPGYELRRRGFNLYMQRPIGQVYSVGITYNFERVNLDTTSVARLELDPRLTDLYNKSSILLSGTQNTTDDMFFPQRGFNNSLILKYSGFLGEYLYIKWLADIRHYHFVQNMVVATRIKFGSISPLRAGGFIPVEDRFFSGGATSNRGWLRHELGPQDAQGNPSGGNSLLECNLEFRIPLFGSFRSALFWDFGNVWQNEPIYQWDEIRHALGLGLRFETPIGPVRLDVARPVYDEKTHYRWHLTIGQAF